MVSGTPDSYTKMKLAKFGYKKVSEMEKEVVTNN